LRIKINLKGKNIDLPIHYNYAIQGLLYNIITQKFKDAHDIGEVYENQKFKPFCFSRIFSSKYEIKDKRILFDGEIYFIFSSPFSDISDHVVNYFLNNNTVRLGDNIVSVSSLKSNDYKLKSSMKVRALCPITVYETQKNEDSKFVRFFSPDMVEFKECIKSNMNKKAAILGIRSGTFDISPFKVTEKDEKVIRYKQSIIKGWTGIYSISGSDEMMRIAFEWGLGVKNSEGFGMVEEV